MKWHLRKGGRVTGPWEEEALRERIGRGEVNSMDEVSEDGATWMRVRATALWAPLPVPEPPAAPPSPQEEVPASGLRIRIARPLENPADGGMGGMDWLGAGGVPPAWTKRPIGFLEAWKRGWTRWSFEGRASVPEYWWRCLSSIVEFLLIFFILGMCFELADETGDPAALEVVSIVAAIPVSLYGLATSWTGLCLAVRRLHDSGKSGWHYWVLLIPLAGEILLLLYLLEESDQGVNEYGEESVLWVRRQG